MRQRTKIAIAAGGVSLLGAVVWWSRRPRGEPPQAAMQVTDPQPQQQVIEWDQNGKHYRLEFGPVEEKP